MTAFILELIFWIFDGEVFFSFSSNMHPACRNSNHHSNRNWIKTEKRSNPHQPEHEHPENSSELPSDAPLTKGLREVGKWHLIFILHRLIMPLISDFVPNPCPIKWQSVDSNGSNRCNIRAGHREKTYDLHGFTLIERYFFDLRV